MQQKIDQLRRVVIEDPDDFDHYFRLGLEASRQGHFPKNPDVKKGNWIYNGPGVWQPIYIKACGPKQAIVVKIRDWYRAFRFGDDLAIFNTYSRRYSRKSLIGCVVLPFDHYRNPPEAYDEETRNNLGVVKMVHFMRSYYKKHPIPGNGNLKGVGHYNRKFDMVIKGYIYSLR